MISDNKYHFEKEYPNIQFVQYFGGNFSHSDIFHLHIPLMKATHHIVDEKLLKCMKKGSLLVNTARGPIVDFEDIITTY